MSELKSCPYCGAPVEELSDGRHTWGLVRHHSGCLFPNLHNHEIPECDFEAWNTRAERTCGVDGTIQWQWMGPTTYFEYELSCGHVITSTDEEPPNYCEECGAKVVSE